MYLPLLKFYARAPACDLSHRTIQAYYFCVDLAIFPILFMKTVFSELTIGIINWKKAIFMRIILIRNKATPEKNQL